MLIVPNLLCTRVCVCVRLQVHIQYVVRESLNDIELHVGVYLYTCAGVYVCAPSVRNPLNVWPPLKCVSVFGSV